jgi:hypothetical protein
MTFEHRATTLGAAMPVPAVTSLGGHKWLPGVYDPVGDYNTSTSFLYKQYGPVGHLTATTGYLGGTATTLALADYSALAGRDNNWVPASAELGTADCGLRRGVHHDFSLRKMPDSRKSASVVYCSGWNE